MCTVSHHEALLILIKDQLERHARSIDMPHFISVPTLQLREYASTFERIRSRESLTAVVKEIISFAATNRERARIVSFTLPHLLRLCSTANKRHLLTVVLNHPSKSLRKRLAYGVIRSASGREQLLELLTPARARQLANCGSRKLTELVAKALVLRTLEPFNVPFGMWQRRFKDNNSKNRQTARERVRELESVARKGLEALDKLSYLSHKPRSKSETRPLIPARPLHDARMTLSSIVKASEKLRAGPRPTYGRLREFVNVASRRLSLERSDGIRLLQSHTLPDKDLWKPNLVQRFITAFRLIPESERLMTPHLREFMLSKTENAAERRQSGRVALSYPGELFRWRDARYEGCSSLTRLVLHEVAHSIQMGHEGKIMKWDNATGELFSPNNPLIDLKGFFALSDWRVVGFFDSSAFIDKHAIRIGDRTYPLGRPLTIELPLTPSAGVTRTPMEVVLRRENNFVYAHRVDAKFSLNNYALTAPEEDWAEAFTEYVICPDRLIELAPEKFHYMEIHFRMYRSARDFARLNAAWRALRASDGAPRLSAPPSQKTRAEGQPEQTEFAFMR